MALTKAQGRWGYGQISLKVSSYESVIFILLRIVTCRSAIVQAFAM